jgi:hypothetical protein
MAGDCAINTRHGTGIAGWALRGVERRRLHPTTAQFGNLIRGKIERIHSRPGSSFDLLPDRRVVQIRPQRSRVVVSKAVSIIRAARRLGTRWQADPERRAGHGPSTGSRAATIARNRTASVNTGDRLDIGRKT